MMEQPNDIEQTFLREIAAKPADNAARLIYADWLDEQGDPRAEYLRVHCELSTLSPADEHYQILLDRERELQADLDPDWLREVGQPRIENCDNAGGLLEFAYQCPKAWNGLHLTQNNGIRHCDACREDVYFCESIHDARYFASLGFCIAVNPSLVRQDGDLKPIPQLPEGEIRDNRERSDEDILLMGEVVTMGIICFDEPEVPEQKPPRRRKRNRRRE